MKYNQTSNSRLASNRKSNLKSPYQDSPSQFVLPRQGWQDKQAFKKALIKAKRAIDIAEISNLLD